MKPIERSELLDLGAYEGIRERFRARVLAEKKPRYVALGANITVLFENRDSVLFQVQEMLRTERITAEKAIAHELETYNELLPGQGELSATVFIEYPEREERERMLETLAGIEDKIYLAIEGERQGITPDPRSTDPARTLAVHYVKFKLTDAARKALVAGTGSPTLGVDHPAYRAETALGKATVQSLREDFA
jgi:hypothetical protein